MNILPKQLLALIMVLSCITGLRGQYNKVPSIEKIGEVKTSRSYNEVFNILQVSPSSQTDLGALTIPEQDLLNVESDPPIIGIVRSLSEPFIVAPSGKIVPPNYLKKCDQIINNDSLVVLTSKVSSLGAEAIRIKFTMDKVLSHNVKIYVYNDKGEIYSPYSSEMFYDGILWSHLIFSDNVYIQVQIPTGKDLESFSNIKIEEISHITFNPYKSYECTEDVNCAAANSFNGISSLKESVAGIAYIGDKYNLWCSGALLNNANSSQQYQPLFQTVSHCISSNNQAQTASFLFDYRTSSCWSGSVTDHQVLQAHVLYAGGENTFDYTLLLLEDIPGGTTSFLGWDNSEVTNGTILYNVSHPEGEMQRYSETEKVFTYLYERCITASATKYDYTTEVLGAAAPGSSGSPYVIYDNGSTYNVGALRGPCHDATNICNYNEYFIVYSRLHYAWDNVQSWLLGTASTNLEANQNSLSFPNTYLSSYNDLTVYLYNTTPTGFNLDLDIEINGSNSNQFSLLSDNSLYIPPSNWKTVSVRFQPTSGGVKSANLNIYHNATNIASPLVIPLTGCAIPGQPGSIIGNTQVCQGTTQTYSISSVTGATSYTWTIPSGWSGNSSSTAINVTVGSASGNISVAANNSCGTSPIRSKSITVNSIPSQPGTISGNTIVCQGSNNTYSISTVSGAESYTWILPNGWSGSSSSNIISTTAGNTGGLISVTANNSCGSSPIRTKSVSVNLLPPQPGLISGNSTVCEGSNNTYSITPVTGADYYTWTLPSGWSGSSSSNIINTTAGSSSGNITVKANNSCGSGPIRTKSILTTLIPSQPSPISGNSTPISGTYESYNVTNVSGITYNWSFPSGWVQTSGGTSNSVIVSVGTLSGNIEVQPSNSCDIGPSRYLFVNPQSSSSEIVVSPIEYNFGTVCDFISDPVMFTITSVGEAPAEFNIPISSTPPDFIVSSGYGTFILNPGNSHSFYIEFDPDDAAIYSSLLTIAGVGTTNNIVIPLMGESVFSKIVNIDDSPSGAGILSGEGSYCPGEQCCINASANSGYLFDYWEEISIGLGIVSYSEEYCFEVENFYEDYLFIAHFTEINSELTLSPESYDFGIVSIWDYVCEDFTLINSGSIIQDGTIYAGPGLKYTIAGEHSIPFSLLPGESLNFPVCLWPNDLFGTHSGNLEIVSNQGLYINASLVGTAVIDATVTTISLPSEGGTTTPDYLNTYTYEEFCINATANPGYVFDYWEELFFDMTGLGVVGPNLEYCFTVEPSYFSDYYFLGHFKAVSFNLTIALEGPFNNLTGLMNSINPDIIEFNQPFNTQPWNYAGDENLVVLPNSNIVDWVLIEYRNTSGEVYSATSSTTIGKQAALLLNDGSIVDIDGISFLTNPVPITDNLFIVVWHRNHLGIISSTPIEQSDGLYSYDFTSSVNQAYGNDLALKEVFPGIWAMIAGDADADGIVDNNDKLNYWEENAGKKGYLMSDFNIDGIVDNKDKNDYWFANHGFMSKVPSEDFICGDILLDSRDGQTYTTVLVGSRCWMAENLNFDAPYNMCYDDLTANCDIYGKLYDQYSASNTCPEGWHLPSQGEWQLLFNNLGGNSVAGGKLKATGTIGGGDGLWIAPNEGATNESGFSAIPGGFYYAYSTTGTNYYDIDTSAYFWTSTEKITPYYYTTRLGYYSGYSYFSYFEEVDGASVRCIKDGLTVNLPPIIPDGQSPWINTSNISINTTLSWNCGDPEGDIITYDVYLDTNNPPTTVLSTGQPENSFDPGGLDYGTTYYWRIVAHDDDNMTPGYVWWFTTEQSPTWQCGDQLIDTRDSQIYETVEIGTQCWMAENFNFGSMIQSSVSPSSGNGVEKYCYDNDPANCNSYGALYDWNEMMEYSSIDSAQGICPDGWHVASDAEWCTLENYVDNSGVSCSETGWRGTIVGQKLKSQTGWNGGGNGDDEFGLSILPAGYKYYSDGTFNFKTIYAFMWTSTVGIGGKSNYRGVSWENSQLYRNDGSQNYGFSVRCIKD